jgi:hypothetical protein
VTPASETADRQFRRLGSVWLSKYRSGGLDSWKLRAAPPSDAARMIMPNYAPTIVAGLDALRGTHPDLRGALFRWYREHVEPLLSDQMKSGIAGEWCKQDDVPEIRLWCKEQGPTR